MVLLHRSHLALCVLATALCVPSLAGQCSDLHHQYRGGPLVPQSDRSNARQSDRPTDARMSGRRSLQTRLAAGSRAQVRGTAIVAQRGRTSAGVLKIRWEYPVPAESESGRAGDAALAAVRSDDKRPLLVVRECRACKGTDDAVLSRTANDEYIQTMARWFRCVKLPDHVLEETHPFRELFATEGSGPPHVFVMSADGERRIDLAGSYQATDVRDAMVAVLEHDYRGKPQKTARKLVSMLSDFDELDAKKKRINRKLDRALESEAATDRLVASLRRDLRDVSDKRKNALREYDRLANLKSR